MSNNQNERKALGRGLAALLGDSAKQTSQAGMPAAAKPEKIENEVPRQTIQAKGIVEKNTPESASEELYQIVSLDLIEANPDQPRKTFNQAALEELAQSLKEQGLVQPIVVKKMAGGRFQIVAGERRFRASKIAGLKNIPVVLRQSETTTVENDLASLVENIQREELNSIELAKAYDRVLRNHQMTQEALANKMGVSRVALANTLRLLRLPEEVKELVTQGRLSEGHSRALLTLENPELIIQTAKKILETGATVRQVEELVRQTMAAKANPSSSSQSTGTHPTAAKNEQISGLESELRQIFGTKSVIRGGGTRGTIEIYYTGEDSFNRILHAIRAIPK